jgi:cytochrome c-type biogenesis protein CcmH/NrfG
MNKFKIFSLALVATTVAKAQDLEPAKKAIDAEQFEKAKSLLKSVIQAKPSNGKAAFLLGNIYLKQNIADSASIYFQKGLGAAEGAKFNNIGLGQMDLDANNKAAAQAKFDLVTKDLKKKDTEEYVYIARAFMNADKPDYASAITVLTKAATANPNDAQVQLALGDAYYGEKKQNEAYVAYRNAYQADNSLIRAKMQLGVLLKGAKAYTEAVKAYNEVITINPNYGPVYRELAETHYLWGNNVPSTYTENIQKALSFYEKYMSLTDYSITSRMRHADFLILAKDYKALEVEANKMKELDGVNPRILRYLGYSAFENGNADAALEALQKYTSNPANKIIPRDYLYLGQAKIKKGTSADGKTVDPTLLAAAMADFQKAIDMEPLVLREFSELGKTYFGLKLYDVSAYFYGKSIELVDSKTYLEDALYYAICVVTANRGKTGAELDTVSLEKADKAMDDFIVKKPDYQDAYLYKARINNVLEKDDVMAANFQLYIDAVTAKGEAEVAKNKAKFIEAYNNIASFYANTDKAKAKELLNKTLALDPANAYALEAIKLLK